MERKGSTERRAIDVVVVELMGEVLEEGECCVEQEKRSGGCTSGLFDELEGEPTEERILLGRSQERGEEDRRGKRGRVSGFRQAN